ncbi:MAG: chromate transporter [Comamonas sp.]|nr:chromate transporter [Candidatus Comamonas equi]
MNAALTPLSLDAASWLHLAAYFLSLSLLSVGGAMATAPDMYRHTVEQQGWLSPQQFSDSIAIAQAAPGPNIMYVALLGWNLGLNAMSPYSGWAAWLVALAGCMTCMACMLLPSSLLTWGSTRWLRRNQTRRSVRAFRWGMMPLVVGMVLATGWILAARDTAAITPWAPWLLTAVTTLLVWKSKLHLLWLLLAGALLGAGGWL